MRHTRYVFILSLAFLLGMSPQGFADTTTVTTRVKIIVPEINELNIITERADITTDIANSEEQTEFSYNISVTGCRPRKITARLRRPLPEGIRMYIELAPPGGGKSTGKQFLSTEPVTLLSSLYDLWEKDGTGTLGLLAGQGTGGQSGHSKIVFALEYE